MATEVEGKNIRSPAGYALVAAAASLWGCWALVVRAAGLPGPAFSFVVFCVMALPAPVALWRAPRGADRGATWRWWGWG